jgi:hypothetical protein
MSSGAVSWKALIEMIAVQVLILALITGGTGTFDYEAVAITYNGRVMCCYGLPRIGAGSVI